MKLIKPLVFHDGKQLDYDLVDYEVGVVASHDDYSGERIIRPYEFGELSAICRPCYFQDKDGNELYEGDVVVDIQNTTPLYCNYAIIEYDGGCSKLSYKGSGEYLDEYENTAQLVRLGNINDKAWLTKFKAEHKEVEG